jgi:hypothetical protein
VRGHRSIWILALALFATVAPVGAQSAVASSNPRAAEPFSKPPASRGRTRDRLLERFEGARRHDSISLHWATYPIVGGTTVSAASAHYSSAEIGQVLAVLGTLPHGAEMNSLSVYVATQQEIGTTCGAETMGCYLPDADRMVVSGSSTPVAGISRQHAIAHEYGHHIANNRLTGLPWPALDAGTERWATYEHVCERARQGSAFPGNEGDHYWDNPGEAFAESYADLTYPVDGLAWDYSSQLAPDATSLSLVAQDVAHPWTGPQTVVWRSRLGPGHRHAVDTVATPLDGSLVAKLTGAASAKFHLRLQSADRISRRRTAKRGQAEQEADATVCGQRTVRLDVRSSKGSGRFAVSIIRP